MKHFALYLLFMFSAGAASAQTDSMVIWNKWCSGKDTLLLFIKANNLLQIYSNTIKLDNILLKPLDKTLKIGRPEIKKDTLSVLAMPYTTGVKKMRLAILDKTTKKVLKTYTFTGDNIPVPEAHLGNLPQASEAAKKDILAQIALRVSFPNSLYSYPYKVKQYTFKIHNDNRVDSVLVSGFMIPKEVVKDIFASPVGATIEFTGILASCPDCDTRELKDIKMKIK